MTVAAKHFFFPKSEMTVAATRFFFFFFPKSEMTVAASDVFAKSKIELEIQTWKKTGK